MEGTTRYFDRKVQSLIRSRMEEVIRGICTSVGASYSFDYNEGYIPLVNNPERVSFLKQVVDAYLEAALEAGYREVRLIHGRGKGVQRARVQRLLARDRRVERFTDAPPGRGGWGATLVWLRPP